MPAGTSACATFHSKASRLALQALDKLDELAVAGVAAGRGAGFQVVEAEAVTLASASAHEPLHRIARRRFGDQVPQAPGEDGDGTAAPVFED